MTDQELLQRYKDGDQDAFTDFFNRHVESVTQWVAERWKLALSDIDIAVQSAFVAIAKRDEIPDNPRVFLEQYAICEAKNIKRAKRRRAAKFTSVHEIDFDNVSIQGDRLTANFIAPEPVEEHQSDWLDRALEQLPPKEREVICELRKDGNVSRIARSLGVVWRTVERRRDRAIENLKPLLA